MQPKDKDRDKIEPDTLRFDLYTIEPPNLSAIGGSIKVVPMMMNVDLLVAATNSTARSNGTVGRAFAQIGTTSSQSCSCHTTNSWMLIIWVSSSAPRCCLSCTNPIGSSVLLRSLLPPPREKVTRLSRGYFYIHDIPSETILTGRMRRDSERQAR